MPLVTIAAPTESQIPLVCKIAKDFLNTKRFCCCVPVGNQTVSDSIIKKHWTKHPNVQKFAALALGESGEPLGFMQLIFAGMPCDLHTSKKGECYIETLAVLPEARGKGVGTMMLEYAESVAVKEGCEVLSLEVLNGNPAARLYSRFGFVEKTQSACEDCLGMLIVSCLLGRVYGCFGPCGAKTMEKPLAGGEGEAVEGGGAGGSGAEVAMER